MSIRDQASTSGWTKCQRSRSSLAYPNLAAFRHMALTIVCATQLLLTSPGSMAADGAMGWEEATGQLASLRTKVEACIGVLKGYGSAAQQTEGRLTYANAKGDIDAVITGLTIALATGGQPDSLPSLQDRLTRGSSGVQMVCRSAREISPSTEGHKGIVDEIAKAVIDSLLKSVSDAVAVLYRDHRADAALIRKTIQTQLEAARWTEFDKVPKV